MPITALPTPPQPSDSPAAFNTRAFNLLGALPAFVSEANGLEAENAAAATAAANAVLASKTTGPASSTDNTIPRFDGTTGKLLQGSGVVADDSGSLLVNTTAPNASWGKQVRIADTNYPALSIVSTAATNGREYTFGLNGTASGPSYLELWDQSNGRSILQIAADSSELTFRRGAFGYGAGTGGTVTQATSKTTGVTLNKPNGVITTHNASLGVGASAYFVLNNTFISGLMDKVVITTGAFGARYRVLPQGVTSGQVGILVENISGVAQTDAIEIGFAIIKGSTT